MNKTIVERRYVFNRLFVLEFHREPLDRDFELVQAPASFGEAWLEARGARRMIWFAFSGRISTSDRISSATWNLFMKGRSA